MGIGTRFMALFRARANKAIDAAESEDLSGILEVSLDDEKKNLQAAEVALNELGGQVKSMEQNVAELEQSVAQWGHDAETSLAKGNEALAKQALMRKASVAQELEIKKAALAAVKANHAKLTQDILDREEKVRNATSKLATLRAEEKAADITLNARKTVGAHAGDGIALNQVEVFEQRVKDKVNTAAAASEFDDKASGADVDRQFADLRKATAVDDELAALKAKVAPAAQGSPKA